MVEVLSVVVIVGILSALAVPRFLANSGKSQLDADANRLFLDLQWARTFSSKTQRRVYVAFDATARSWSVYKECSSPLNATLETSADCLVQRDSLGTSVRFGFGHDFASVPSTAPPGTAGLTSTSVPQGGFAAGASGDDCVEGASSGTGTWAGTIVVCGGRGVSDIETGALYLSSTRTSAFAQAILYNDQGSSGSLQLQRWQWSGSGWERR
jgi:type II secretory pathway pseudopilin PulG